MRRPTLTIANLFPAAAAIVLAAAAPLAVAVAQNPPRPGEPVVVMTAPWNSVSELAEKADVNLVAPGRVAAVGLVWSRDGDFDERLYAAGALLLLDGALSRAFCRVEG